MSALLLGTHGAADDHLLLTDWLAQVHHRRNDAATRDMLRQAGHDGLETLALRTRGRSCGACDHSATGWNAFFAR